MTTKTNKLSQPAPKSSQQNLYIVAGITVLALIAALIFIIISSSSSISSSIDYSTIPNFRTDDGAFVLGNPEAPITIVEFADFMCPHCQRYKPTINQVISELVATGQAQFEFRMIATQGQRSIFAAQLAECADDQRPGAFWTAYDILYDMGSRGQFGMDSGSEFAKRIQMDYSKLLDCNDTANQINIDSRYGTAQGVEGTPTLMVRYGNGELSPLGGTNVSFDQIRELVQAANENS